MKKSITMAVASIATGALLLPLAACGSDSASGKTTISFLSWDSEQIMKPFIDKFEEENSDINIDFSYSPPTAEYIQTLQTRLVGNQAPDVFVITSENKADLIDNNYVLDMTDKSYTEKLSESNKQFVSRDGKLYGQSISSWSVGMIYNEDLLKKVGYDTVPATWDEYLELCGKLKDIGVTPYVETLANGSNTPIPDSFQGAMLAKKGVDLTTLASEDPQTPGKDEKDAIAAWYKLYEKGYASRDNVGISNDDAKTQFANGQVATMAIGPWDLNSFADVSFGWEFTQIPAYDEGYERYAQGSPSPGLAIYSKLSGEKLKAAEKFLTFMVSDWALDQRTKNGDAITVQGYTSGVSDKYKEVYEKNVQTGKYYLTSNFYQNPDVFSTTNSAELQQLVQGSITVDQWVANVDKKMADAQ